MRSLFAVAACACLVACASVKAEPMFVSGDVHITFHSRACEHVALANFLKQFGDEPKAATVNFRGQMLEACYVVDEDGDYALVDKRGAGGFIPGKQIQHGA
jgi:hypothetical protein